MNILITDDEPLARERLGHLIEEIDMATVVGEAANGKQALHQTNQLKPDIILLDIRMPVMDGLETAKHLNLLDHPPAIIFTTAFGEHALTAFEANAVAFLLKPIRKEQLSKALNKASKLSQMQLNALNNDPIIRRQRRHISVRIRETLELIPVFDILYFSAEDKYVIVHHKGGEALAEESLKALEDEFDPRFIRIHRNALISTAFLKGIEKGSNGSFHAILDDTDQRPEISRRHLGKIKKALMTRDLI